MCAPVHFHSEFSQFAFVLLIDDRFYMALYVIVRSRADPLRFGRMRFQMSDCSLICIVRLEYSPKWCMYSAVWLSRGWCHVELLPARRVLCTPYNHALCRVTSYKATYVGCRGMRV